MPTELHLKLMDETPNSSVSRLKHGNKFQCFIIEDGFHEIKIAGQTRIPAGRYPLIKRTWGGFFERYKTKYGHPFVIEIANVPGYGDILFHIGNRITDTRGCLLTNDSITFDKSANDYVGITSEVAYKKFMSVMIPLMNADSVFLNVNRCICQ